MASISSWLFILFVSVDVSPIILLLDPIHSSGGAPWVKSTQNSTKECEDWYQERTQWRTDPVMEPDEVRQLKGSKRFYTCNLGNSVSLSGDYVRLSLYHM